MKILHWSFILVAIILPVSIICRVTVNNRFAALKDEIRINNAIDTATKDAIDQIIAVSGFDYDNEFGNVINISPELAQESINTFFHTLAVNYNIPFKISDTTVLTGSSSSSYIKSYFSTYVPAVVVIAYDGFYVYSQELTDIGYEYKLSSKIPYAYDFGDYTVGYTLGNDIYFYIDGKCYSGKLKYNSRNDIITSYNNEYSEKSADEISLLTDDISMVLYSINSKPGGKSIGNELLPSTSTTNFLQDYTVDENGNYSVGDFHKKRREVIIKIISDCLREEINVEHNRFAGITGSTYDFYLPEITDDDWINSINDITVMAFVQGIPVGTLNGHFYNNYALGGSQIVNRDYIYVNKVHSNYSGNDIPLYHRKGCSLINDENGNPTKYDEIFLTEDDAIANGYLPCQVCN